MSPQNNFDFCLISTRLLLWLVKIPSPSGSAVAKATSRRFNWAWFLEKLSLPLLLAGLLGAILVMLARREWAEFPWLPFLAVAGGLVATVILIAWLIARRHFTSQEKALVRIESAMTLNNSLTAARERHRSLAAPLPKRPATAPLGTGPALLVPPLATLLLLSAAFLLPISAKSRCQCLASPEEPANRQSLQASIDELRKDEVIEEDYLG